VQLYSDGNESAWIEPTVEGQEEPERPAPVLTLTSESSPGALALFLAILALLVAVGGVVLGWRANRRTVSS
jgi:hypothetical protein